MVSEIKNIALILPNLLLRERFGDPSDPPLGIAYIASVLLENKYNVIIIDAYAENLDNHQIIEILKKNKIQLVGISCNYAPLHNPTLDLVEKIKKSFDHIYTALGGNHASAMAKHLMEKSPYIDFIIVGEGEKTMINLLKALNNNIAVEKVKGLFLKKNNSIILTGYEELIPDLDDIPFPAYDLLPMDKYKRYNIITSRGCPYQCTYCASNIIFNKKVRYRKPEKVVEEITYLIKKFGSKQIWFSDDTFTSNIRYTEKLLKCITTSGLSIKWSCLTRVNKMNKDLLIKMKEAGCDYISYGIETGSPKILKDINKKITFKEIVETINNTTEVGIRAYGFFIVGFPQETWDDIYETYKLISKINIEGAAFNILIPLPGTKIMEYLLNNGFITLDEIKWDYLFARTINNENENYPAILAEKWTKVSSKDLIDACTIGSKLPEIFRRIK